VVVSGLKPDGRAHPVLAALDGAAFVPSATKDEAMVVRPIERHEGSRKR